MPTSLDGNQTISIDSQTDGATDRRKDSHGDGATSDGVVNVLANHNGGVTKTTSTANLGAMLAEAGRRVLVVDCDPQANLSEAFGWARSDPASVWRDLLIVREAAGRFSPPRALDPEVAGQLVWGEGPADLPLYRCAGRHRRRPAGHPRRGLRDAARRSPAPSASPV